MGDLPFPGFPIDHDCESLKYAIGDCLTSLEATTPPFALFEPLSNVPTPGLYLKNAGTVGLPLSDRDAQVFVGFCGDSSAEQETKGRKTWEISRNHFEMRNPAWRSFLDGVVAKVSTSLGLDATGTIAAEILKLTLYEEGAIVQPVEA